MKHIHEVTRSHQPVGLGGGAETMTGRIAESDSGGDALADDRGLYCMKSRYPMQPYALLFHREAPRDSA